METKKRLLYIFSISLSLLIGTLVVFSRFVFYSEFEQLEYKQIDIDNEIVRNTILKDLGKLSFKNKEWATRESNYILLKNQQYKEFEKNLNLSALRNLNIDLFIYGSSKKLRNGYNLAYDNNMNSMGLKNISRDFLKKLNETIPSSQKHNILEIYNFDKFGSWLISKVPVTDRYSTEAPVGQMIMATKLDSSYFLKLSQRLAISVYKKGIQKEVRQDKYNVDKNLVTDYGLKLNTNDYFVFSIFHTPEILIAGNKSFKLFFITSSLMIILIMGLTYFILQRSVFSPILTLQREVSSLDINNLKEIKIKNSDHDIKELTQTINSLIARVKGDYELLVQKGKLESLGLMAGGIAHEVNNPLTILKANTSIILRQLTESTSIEDKSISNKLLKNLSTIDRIAAIINGLQKISRQSSEDTLVLIDPITIMKNIEELHNSIVDDKNIIVEYSVNDYGLKFNGLEQQISQIIINLIMNSVQAITDLEEKWIKLVLFKRKNQAVFRVIDSGKGIKDELRQKIMEPFFTTKEIGKGTGLGLSICRKIAHFHGGDLQLISEEVNTTFELTIPLFNENSSSVA